MGNTSSFLPPSEQKSLPRWVWIVLMIVIIFALLWVSRNSPLLRPLRDFILGFDEPAGVSEEERILNAKSIRGTVDLITPERLTLKTSHDNLQELQISITPKTVFYTLTNDSIPQKINISANEITNGATVTVKMNESINAQVPLRAVEVVLFR